MTSPASPSDTPRITDLGGCRAVVTGGASGIGRGLATAMIERGAAGVVLADVEEAALAAAAEELAGPPAHVHADVQVHAVATDVTDPSSVGELAARSAELLGGVDVVCLNAGVFAGGHVWETTQDDWDWVLGVNLRGVVNGIRSFLPGLLADPSPSHVIVTASIAGLVAAPTSGVYCTSKFAAVGLTESLHHDLQLVGANHIGVSLLCPAMVRTNIGEGARNRPDRLRDATHTDATELAAGGIRDSMARGLGPLEGAREALDQAAAGRFYVSTHPVELWERLVGNENEDRLAGRPPRFQMYE